jgi:uncharacterized membrane protein YeiH
MAAILKHPLVRRFGWMYLAYEALSLAAFLVFGAQFLPLH